MLKANSKFVTLIALAFMFVFLLCVCTGSVYIHPSKALGALFGFQKPGDSMTNIIKNVRVPRVICAALIGASLSLCGASMQGMLKNPLADGSTMGVSSAASLGAVLAIALGINTNAIVFNATTVLAVVFAFVYMLIIIGITYRLDQFLSTNTIILMGIVFSTFANSMITLIIAFADRQIAAVTFWLMGSMQGRDYGDAMLLACALIGASVYILSHSRELNAFAIGEDNARHIGVDVKRIRLGLMISVSILMGVCVSVGGSIGFVGLMIPHIARILTGSNHHTLLPVSLALGAIFLMIADLLCRVIIIPLEMPIGVITSIAGSIMFVYIFVKFRKA
jgi:iron complex transport system permease protein